MPDLQPTIELGPSVDWHLWRSKSGDAQPRPRAAAARADHAGELAAVDRLGVLAAHQSSTSTISAASRAGTFGVGAGPVFADDRYHDYFYTVQPALRDGGAAGRMRRDGGYSGVHLLTSLSKRFPDYWIGAYLRYDVLSGASSTTVRWSGRNSYLAGGIGIAWMIGESKRMVESDD